MSFQTWPGMKCLVGLAGAVGEPRKLTQSACRRTAPWSKSQLCPVTKQPWRCDLKWALGWNVEQNIPKDALPSNYSMHRAAGRLNAGVADRPVSSHSTPPPQSPAFSKPAFLTPVPTLPIHAPITASKSPQSIYHSEYCLYLLV